MGEQGASQSWVQEKCRELGGFYHPVQNILPSLLLSRNLNIMV
jgi:hypothetical protein